MSDPLYQRVVAVRQAPAPRVTGILYMWMLMFGGMGFCMTVVFDWIPGLLLFIFLSANTVYGVMAGLQVSGNIVKEKEHQRFHLLASLPGGSLQTSWAICAAALHRRSRFVWGAFFVRLATLVLLSTLIAILLITLLLMGNTTTPTARYSDTLTLRLTIAGIGLAVGFFFDHFYSVVTALLLGMLAPIDTTNRFEARFRALLAFLGLQATLYIVAGAFIFLVGDLTQPYLRDNVGLVLLQTIAGLASFLLLREIITRLLWRRLVDALNAADPEAKALLRGVV